MNNRLFKAAMGPSAAFPVSPAVRRALFRLEVATTAQAALVIGHFAYGAHIYDDPSRYHIVVPSFAALAITVVLAAVYAWRGWPAVRWLLVVAVGLPFIVVFGLYHGGFSHTLKLLFFLWGMSTERLEAIFDSPDFAVPNSVVFEVTGVATFLLAIAITYLLVRMLRLSGREREGNDSGAATATAARDVSS
jgi:hypothetical protein